MREHGPSFSLVAIIIFVMTVLLNKRLKHYNIDDEAVENEQPGGTEGGRYGNDQNFWRSGKTYRINEY